MMPGAPLGVADRYARGPQPIGGIGQQLPPGLGPYSPPQMVSVGTATVINIGCFKVTVEAKGGAVALTLSGGHYDGYLLSNEDFGRLCEALAGIRLVEKEVKP